MRTGLINCLRTPLQIFWIRHCLPPPTFQHFRIRHWYSLTCLLKAWFFYFVQEEEIEEEDEEEEETEEDAIDRIKSEISENYESELNLVTGAVVSISTSLPASNVFIQCIFVAVISRFVLFPVLLTVSAFFRVILILFFK